MNKAKAKGNLAKQLLQLLRRLTNAPGQISIQIRNTIIGSMPLVSRTRIGGGGVKAASRRQAPNIPSMFALCGVGVFTTSVPGTEFITGSQRQRQQQQQEQEQNNVGCRGKDKGKDA